MIALALLVALGGFEPDALLPGKPWVLRGHTDSVVAIAFSPDGGQLASAGRDKAVKLWDLNTGALVRSVALGEQQLSCLAFSRDGLRLAVGDVGLQAQVLDVATGKVLLTIAHPDAVGELAFSPDGRWLAIAGLSDTSAVYDAQKGTRRFTFQGRTVRFVPDGKTLIVSNGAGALTLVDATTGKVRTTVKAADDVVLAVATPDGARIATWSPTGVDVKVWTALGKPQGTLKGPPPAPERRTARVTGVALSTDGKRVISGGGDGYVRVWDLATSAVILSYPAEKNSAVVVSADSVWVAVADSGLVKLWKLP